MEEQLIRFQTAKLAKEKGFREHCCYAYTNDGKFFYHDEDGYYWESYTISPTQSLLQKYLREVHNINIDIETLVKNENIVYSFDLIYILETLHVKPFKQRYFSYEEALEEGLYQALLLIKN